jgi:transposase
MRFVPVKQVSLSMHRKRDLLVKQRTQSINMIRGLLAEFGVKGPNSEPATRCLAKLMDWRLLGGTYYSLRTG